MTSLSSLSMVLSAFYVNTLTQIECFEFKMDASHLFCFLRLIVLSFRLAFLNILSFLYLTMTVYLYGFLVSKETVVLRRWERSKQKFGFIKRVDKWWITTVKDFENQNWFFNWVHSLHTELINASHSTNLFTNSCNHISTNGNALQHSHINHNNPQFLYSPWRRANARNVSFLNLSRW